MFPFDDIIMAVCCSGVCNNSIQSPQRKLCVHMGCSGITKRLLADPNNVCDRCDGEARPIYGSTVTEVDVDSTMLDVEATFCYLGDMLCSGGDCDSAIAARYCVVGES